MGRVYEVSVLSLNEACPMLSSFIKKMFDRKTPLRKLVVLPIYTLVIILCSCSSKKTEFPTLVDAGPLPLSSTNPYQGANLFLSRELEKSSYLHQFLSTQGAPGAIAIQSGGMGSLELALFYPESQSIVYADLQEGRHSREWIIRGQFPITREEFLSLRRALPSKNSAPPVFVVHNRQVRFLPQTDRRPRNNFEPEIPNLEPKPKKKSTPAPVVTKKKPEPKAEQPEPKKAPLPEKALTFDDKDFIPANTDQLALLISSGYAAKDSQGNILHQVEDPHETVVAIATWYCGDEDKAADLAEVNGMTVDQQLTPGTTVKVPNKMIARTKKMPLDAFEAP